MRKYLNLIISIFMIVFTLHFFSIKFIYFIFTGLALLLWLGYYYIYKKNIWLINRPLTNISLVIISVLIGIYGLEIGLHLTKPQFLQLSESITGEYSDFTRRNFFHSDFCQKQGVFRILGIGDSFAMFGRGQWNYHDVLQNKFDALYGSSKVEVINTGIASTGPGYYWNTIERHGDLFKPDAIIVGFFIGNDFFELQFDDIRVGLYIKEPRKLAKRMRGYLQLENLWLYQFSEKRITILKEQLRKEKETKNTLVKKNGNFSKAAFLSIERDRLVICKKTRSAWFNKIWQDGAQVFLNMKEWCQKRGIELIVVAFPDEFQVEPDLLQEVMSTYHIEKDTIDILYPNRILRGFFRLHDIHFLDLTLPLQQEAKFKKLYLLHDSHMNQAGNQEAANLIFDYLQKNHLVNFNNSSGKKEIGNQRVLP